VYLLAFPLNTKIQDGTIAIVAALGEKNRSGLRLL
jgi:hypothetical protein